MFLFQQAHLLLDLINLIIQLLVLALKKVRIFRLNGVDLFLQLRILLDFGIELLLQLS